MHRRQSAVAGLLRADSDADSDFAERLRLAPEDGAARVPRSPSKYWPGKRTVSTKSLAALPSPSRFGPTVALPKGS